MQPFTSPCVADTGGDCGTKIRKLPSRSSGLMVTCHHFGKNSITNHKLQVYIYLPVVELFHNSQDYYFKIASESGMLKHCSLWEPVRATPSRKLACLVYVTRFRRVNLSSPSSAKWTLSYQSFLSDDPHTCLKCTKYVILRCDQEIQTRSGLHIVGRK